MKNLCADIIEQGVIDCFPNGLTDEDGQLTYAETSAVVFCNNSLIIASDKDIPNHSPVFSIPYPIKQNLELKAIKYFVHKPFLESKKIEDFALTPDRKHILAITAFDRVNRDTFELDVYNTLLCWPVNDEGRAYIISPTIKGNYKSSVQLRAKFSQALSSREFPQGPPYFKIEGLAIIPGNRILFGIREVGLHHSSFSYAVKVVSVSYTFKNDIISLNDDFKQIYNFESSSSLGIQLPLGLSSIEYDPYNDRIFLLTSFEFGEEKKQIGGYLWSVSTQDFEKNITPSLILNANKSPLTFVNKPEGIAIVDKNSAFIICDDDKILAQNADPKEFSFRRNPNQAAYMILKFHNHSDFT